MTKRAIKNYSPFVFQSDFSVAEPEDDTRIPVSADELAHLLAEARNEGISIANADHDSEISEKMQSATTRLNQALADLVALAGHLEVSGQDAAMSETTRNLINLAAQNIIDGQGDLFHAND